MRDDYDTLVARSLTPGQMRRVIKTMDQLAGVEVWDGEVVVADGNMLLGVIWFNTEIEEWMFDSKRLGEEV